MKWIKKVAGFIKETDAGTLLSTSDIDLYGGMRALEKRFLTVREKVKCTNFTIIITICTRTGKWNWNRIWLPGGN